MPAVLALAAAACWGLGDFLLGVQGRRSPVLAIALVAQASGFVLLTLLVAARGVPAPGGDEMAAGLAAGAVGALAFYLIVTALSMGNMARVAPILGLATLVPVVYGLARGEDPATVQLLGIVVAITGILLVSTERPKADRLPPDPDEAQKNRRAMLMAAVAAVAAGSSLVGIEHASHHDPYWATLLFRTAGVVVLGAVALGVVVAGRVAAGPIARSLALAPLIAFGVLDTTANILWAVASTGDLLSIVAVLGGLFPAVTVLLAVLILREPLERLQAVGVVATLAGTAMITVA
ncbi:MAG: EamA family transporter [Solirubrobacterales bacterium]